MGFKEYFEISRREKVDNVTRGLIVLEAFVFLSMLFPLMIGIILKEPKKKQKNLANFSELNL